MKKHFYSNGITFQVDCFESYEKTKVDEISRKTKEEDLETTFVEGKLKVREITFLKDKYSKKSETISRMNIVRLYKFINEIESTICKTSLLDYYS